MKHKLFIIEGFDRIGKTTTLKAMRRRFPEAKVYLQPTDNDSPEKSMPNYREDPEGFTEWLRGYLKRQVEDLVSMKDNDVIMSRLFISDIVYSKMFNRPCVALEFYNQIANFFDIVHIVLFWDSYQEYTARCRDCHSEIEYSETEFLSLKASYQVAAFKMSDMGDRFFIIDQVKNENSQNEVADMIEKSISGQYQGKHKTKDVKIQTMFQLFWCLYHNDDLNSIRKYLAVRENLDKGIIIAGVGKNFYIAEKIYKTFISMGIKCQALDCVHALHGDLGMVDGQLIFFLSKSGNTEEMVTVAKTLNMLRQKGIKNFKSCGFFLNPRPDFVEYDWMIVPDASYKDTIYEFDSRDLVPSLSINIMQMILDDLGVEVFEMNDDLYENYKYNHMGGTNGKRLGVDKELAKVKTCK